jgi:hypothetical protein
MATCQSKIISRFFKHGSLFLANFIKRNEELWSTDQYSLKHQIFPQALTIHALPKAAFLDAQTMPLLLF